MKTKVVVHFNSTLSHHHQVFCGFELLARDGEIDLEYRFGYGQYPINLMKVEIDGKIAIFDLDDKHQINERFYNECDFFVKRMLLVEDAAKLPRTIPFGLNYPVFAKNSFLRNLYTKDKRLLSYALRYNALFCNVVSVNESVVSCHYTRFENASPMDGKIIFSTRLWNPGNNNDSDKKVERKGLNTERIEIVRRLKQHYPHDFFGGIQNDGFSRQTCPDLVLDQQLVNKKNYLRRLKTYGIAIANQGLEDSIGWKFAEYIANGSAVVSNPIDKYVLHGALKAGVNYLEFKDVDSCMQQVNLLYENHALRSEMGRANQQYYREYLAPKAKMREIIRLIAQKSGQ